MIKLFCWETWPYFEEYLLTALDKPRLKWWYSSASSSSLFEDTFQKKYPPADDEHMGTC
jgi:hypothetical protein